jgi:hypothetical protein
VYFAVYLQHVALCKISALMLSLFLSVCVFLSFFLSSFTFSSFLQDEIFSVLLSLLLPSDKEEGFRGTACLRAATLSTSGLKKGGPAKRGQRQRTSLHKTFTQVPTSHPTPQIRSPNAEK